jgi:hypothetical protein
MIDLKQKRIKTETMCLLYQKFDDIEKLLEILRENKIFNDVDISEIKFYLEQITYILF